MPHAFLCTTCGTQYAESEEAPPRCPVCEDERQYLKPAGQGWTTPDALRRSHRNSLRGEESNLIGVGVDPTFAIGQRALLVRTPHGNVLWDCVPLLDPALAAMIRGLGGLSAIAISHPHYYANLADWGDAFDVPIYLHAADRDWVMRPSSRIVFWDGETYPLADGLTLIRCGGHFPGGAVLHWAAGADGRGALLAGDIIQVCMDRKSVSFMHSYPNYIPLSPAAVGRITAAVAPFAFDAIYGAFWDLVIRSGAKDILARSAARYLRHLEGERPA